MNTQNKIWRGVVKNIASCLYLILFVSITINAHALTINNGATSTTNPIVSLTLSPPSGCTSIQVTQQNGPGVSYNCDTSESFTLSGIAGPSILTAVYYYTYQCGTYQCGSYICGSYKCGLFSTCYTYCPTYCPTYCNSAQNETSSIILYTVPGSPIIGTAGPGNAQATVAFTQPGSDGYLPITGYYVTSNPAGGTDTNTGSTSLSHLITGLTNGQAYTFTVTAMNSLGMGAASAASNSITPTTSLVQRLDGSGSSVVGTYSTIQAALTDPVLAGENMIKMQATTFYESPDFNNPNALVHLIGGFDPLFSSQTDMTTFYGTLTISNGTITADSLTIASPH